MNIPESLSVLYVPTWFRKIDFQEVHSHKCFLLSPFPPGPSNPWVRPPGHRRRKSSLWRHLCPEARWTDRHLPQVRWQSYSCSSSSLPWPTRCWSRRCSPGRRGWSRGGRRCRCRQWGNQGSEGWVGGGWSELKESLLILPSIVWYTMRLQLWFGYCCGQRFIDMALEKF